MRRAWFTATAVALAVALTGCSVSAKTPETSPAPSSSPDFSTLTPLPPGYIDEDSRERYTPHEEPEWDASSRATAITAGEEAMRLFARPKLDHETWWDDLSPLMNDVARQNYAYVQPHSITATKVTGPGQLIDEDSAYIANVEVPTDAGTFVIILNRSDADSPWMIAQYIFPEQS